MKLFSYDSKFAEFTSRIFDYVILHFMWFIFSLPLITIGASTTALYAVSMKMIDGREGSIVESFWIELKRNGKKSTYIWLVEVALLGWLITMTYICAFSKNSILMSFGIMNAGLLLITIASLFYIFPLQARYENTTWNTIKNAYICALKYLPYTVLMIIIFITPVLLTGYLPFLFGIMIFFWIFFGSSIIIYMESIIIKKIFKQCE